MLAQPTVSPETASRPGARAALALLLAINLFNYIDRQVLAAVEPEIRAWLFPESVGDPGEASGAGGRETLAKGKMGLLSDAFLITYMLAAPVFGHLAGRVSRWLLIGFGVILWSLASAGSGWDWGPNLLFAYVMLFLTRCLVGVGEAAYGPAAPVVISDLFPAQNRGLVMSFFYLAIPVGGALGYTFGEIVANSALGWRWAFYLVLPPGVLLGLLCFRMRDPLPEGADTLTPRRALRWNDYWILAKTPSYVFNTLGMAGMTFAIGGMAWWMPAYLVEYRNVEPLFGMGPRTAFGTVTVLAGFIATLAGGLIGDWLRRYYAGSYFLVSGIAMLVAFPMILLMIWMPFPTAWIFVFLAVFCLFFNTGPTNTILANVTHPALRASGFALNIFLIHLLGDVPSPPLMGVIADYTNLDVSFLFVSVAVLIGGIFWLCGTRYLAEDTRLAPTRLNARSA